MKVSENLIKEWADLYEIGDNDKLSKIVGLSPENISRILNGGNSSVSNIAKIQKFFKKRKQLIAKIENDCN